MPNGETPYSRSPSEIAVGAEPRDGRARTLRLLTETARHPPHEFVLKKQRVDRR